MHPHLFQFQVRKNKLTIFNTEKDKKFHCIHWIPQFTTISDAIGSVLAFAILTHFNLLSSLYIMQKHWASFWWMLSSFCLCSNILYGIIKPSNSNFVSLNSALKISGISEMVMKYLRKYLFYYYFSTYWRMNRKEKNSKTNDAIITDIFNPCQRK